MYWRVLYDLLTYIQGACYRSMSYVIFSVSFCFRLLPAISSTTRSIRPLTTCLCTSRSDPPTRPCSSSSSFASTPSPVSPGTTSAGTSCRPCHAQCSRRVSGGVVGQIRSPSKHADSYFNIRSNIAVLTFNTEQTLKLEKINKKSFIPSYTFSYSCLKSCFKGV